MDTELIVVRQGHHHISLAAYLHTSLIRFLFALEEALAAVGGASATPATNGADMPEPDGALSAFALLVVDLCLVALRLAGPGRSGEIVRRPALQDLKAVVRDYTATPFDGLLRGAMREFIRKPGMAQPLATLDLLAEYDRSHQTQHRAQAAALIYTLASALVDPTHHPVPRELQALHQLRKLLNP